jgi:phosphoserine phosphatase
MPKTKLIFFDMEGVIFDTGTVENRPKVAASFWSVISKSLSEEAGKLEDQGKEMWISGKFRSQLEWAEHVIENIHIKHNLTEKKFYGLINNIPFMNGAKETFKQLHKRGYRTAIISGGFKNQADRAIRELGVRHVIAGTEYFFDKKGKLVGWNLLPCDYEGKVEFTRLLMREYKLKPSECAFIGDGVNDIPLAKEVGLSIAFNGRKELQEVCSYSVNQEKKDLQAILKYFP